MTRILGMTAAALMLAMLGGCTAAQRQEACAIDAAAQPIIVPAEGAIGLAVLPAVPFIIAGHIAAQAACVAVGAMVMPAIPSEIP